MHLSLGFGLVSRFDRGEYLAMVVVDADREC